MTSPIWVDNERDANEAIAEIRRYPVAGVDTEFYGVDVRTESTVGRSICHVFSVATPSGPLLPRGFNEASSWVFGANCLAFGSVKDWLEDPRFVKPLHNQPVDHHTFRNHGVSLRGAVNTLAMARWWWPQRAKYEGFDLDTLGKDFCGAGKTESFDELLGYDDTEYRPRAVWKKRCACGQLSCTKKKTGKDGVAHDTKTPEEVVVDQPFKVRRHTPLTDLSPAHPLWARYLAYAAWDAVLALWLYQLMLREGVRERIYPWAVKL